jgi:hypothetical protein
MKSQTRSYLPLTGVVHLLLDLGDETLLRSSSAGAGTIIQSGSSVGTIVVVSKSSSGPSVGSTIVVTRVGPTNIIHTSSRISPIKIVTANSRVVVPAKSMMVFRVANASSSVRSIKIVATNSRVVIPAKSMMVPRVANASSSVGSIIVVATDSSVGSIATNWIFKSLSPALIVTSAMVTQPCASRVVTTARLGRVVSWLRSALTEDAFRDMLANGQVQVPGRQIAQLGRTCDSGARGNTGASASAGAIVAIPGADVLIVSGVGSLWAYPTAESPLPARMVHVRIVPLRV